MDFHMSGWKKAAFSLLSVSAPDPAQAVFPSLSTFTLLGD